MFLNYKGKRKSLGAEGIKTPNFCGLFFSVRNPRFMIEIGKGHQKGGAVHRRKAKIKVAHNNGFQQKKAEKRPKLEDGDVVSKNEMETIYSVRIKKASAISYFFSGLFHQLMAFFPSFDDI